MNSTRVAGRELQIPVGAVTLEGRLELPPGAQGLVVFVHGSGSSRHSRRNQAVAASLVADGLGTLLFDLLTAGEEQVDLRTRHLRFDIDLLTDRVVGALDWLARQPETQRLAFGCFGASTGAAAALRAAAARPDKVRAVVSRGGRPDLAQPVLAQVRAPTLLIVGEADEQVVILNRLAYDLLEGTKQLEIVPGATHLFEEPGALEQVAALAGAWFRRYLHSR
jgi:pimeloyl-ACP methyl ester carboxylesterase